ncbi:hypothetical protein M427DRAFT_319922 [Gonapodya prolifera JEL478]|uniref:Uncharacterized protein n=1 Tax=Gonapodya prolifera (strain JEL478) TaxID=1344416 RepID=A0A139AFU2_GONPJ|nr:hypothetical protein M427DRAFT_319922 [Gonapodya prolifera JEL478]|eukprot:KXS15657.1 hypothetical protein M427DRAFT_319922 [Gonapodya prolifera JEL478]
MYFGRNYVTKMHTDERDTLPYSIGFSNNNDPNGTQIRVVISCYGITPSLSR